MCAADKITGVNALYGAGVTAGAASRAFFVIDGGKVIFNLNCTVRAGLFALTARNAYVKADLAHLSALIVARAFNNNARGVVDKMDDAVGTGLCAKAAADALSRIDLGNEFVCDANGVSRADLYAIAVAKAGKGAEAVA